MVSIVLALALDPAPLVCDEARCSEVFEGIPVVIDDNHPSQLAVLKIGEKQEEQLRWLVESN
jgi:hypothetical protein